MILKTLLLISGHLDWKYLKEKTKIVCKNYHTYLQWSSLKRPKIKTKIVFKNSDTYIQPSRLKKISNKKIKWISKFPYLHKLVPTKKINVRNTIVNEQRLRRPYSIIVYGRRRRSYTPAVYDRPIRPSYCGVFHRIRSLLIDLGVQIWRV